MISGIDDLNHQFTCCGGKMCLNGTSQVSTGEESSNQSVSFCVSKCPVAAAGALQASYLFTPLRCRCLIDPLPTKLDQVRDMLYKSALWTFPPLFFLSFTSTTRTHQHGSKSKRKKNMAPPSGRNRKIGNKFQEQWLESAKEVKKKKREKEEYNRKWLYIRTIESFKAISGNSSPMGARRKSRPLTNLYQPAGLISRNKCNISINTINKGAGGGATKKKNKINTCMKMNRTNQ